MDVLMRSERRRLLLTWLCRCEVVSYSHTASGGEKREWSRTVGSRLGCVCEREKSGARSVGGWERSCFDCGDNLWL